MNKTILISTSIVAFAFVIVSYWYIAYLKTTERNSTIRPMDKFTTCIQTVMSESRQGGNVIDTEKAKDIVYMRRILVLRRKNEIQELCHT